MPSEEKKQANKVAYEARAQNTRRASKKKYSLLSEEIKGARREKYAADSQEREARRGRYEARANVKEYSDTSLIQTKKTQNSPEEAAMSCETCGALRGSNNDDPVSRCESQKPLTRSDRAMTSYYKSRPLTGHTLTPSIQGSSPSEEANNPESIPCGSSHFSLWCIAVQLLLRLVR